MVTLIGLSRTLFVARKPHVILLLRLMNKKRTITFRNGVSLCLNWSQFRDLRDSYSIMQKYSINQLGNDLFRAKFEHFDLAAPMSIICPVSELIEKYTVEKIGDDVFRIKSNTFELVGSSYMLRTVWELDRGEYEGDYAGKVVLDVGGFQGESAVFFHLKGAKKVIIYEPVKAHQDFLKQNILQNCVNAEIHIAGIGPHDGAQIIHFEKTDVTFGPYSKGQLQMEIEVKSVADVIAKSGADIAKFDCEGAEEYLVNVSSEILRKIDLYVLEVHGHERRKAIIKKFEASEFKLMKAEIKGPEIGTFWFSRKR